MYRWTETKELPDVTINGKKLTKGTTWDDALPILERGQRVWLAPTCSLIFDHSTVASMDSRSSVATDHTF